MSSKTMGAAVVASLSSRRPGLGLAVEVEAGAEVVVGAGVAGEGAGAGGMAGEGAGERGAPCCPGVPAKDHQYTAQQTAQK